MILPEKAEIKLKKYKGLNDDDLSVMLLVQFHTRKVLAVQGQSSLPRDIQSSNQIQDVTAPRLK